MNKEEAKAHWLRWRGIMDRIVTNQYYSADLRVWGGKEWRLAVNLSRFAAVQMAIYNDKVWR